MWDAYHYHYRECRGVVEKTIRSGERGRVRCLGSSWPAACNDRRTLILGQPVNIIDSIGMTLLVEPVVDPQIEPVVVSNLATIQREPCTQRILHPHAHLSEHSHPWNETLSVLQGVVLLGYEDRDGNCHSIALSEGAELIVPQQSRHCLLNPHPHHIAVISERKSG